VDESEEIKANILTKMKPHPAGKTTSELEKTFAGIWFR
jgi:hypothetical protein